MVLAYLRSMVKDVHLAEDLTQETLGTFQESGNFGKWLRGIARNKALMHWRAAKRKPLVIDSRVVEGIDEVFDQLDREQEEGDWWETRKRALRECIASLSDQLKEAVEQVYDKGQSLDEAAVALDSNRAAVGQRLSRARKRVRICVTVKLKTEGSYE